VALAQKQIIAMFPLLDHVQQQCRSQHDRARCCFNYCLVARRVIRQSMVLSHERMWRKKTHSLISLRGLDAPYVPRVETRVMCLLLGTMFLGFNQIERRALLCRIFQVTMLERQGLATASNVLSKSPPDKKVRAVLPEPKPHCDTPRSGLRSQIRCHSVDKIWTLIRIGLPRKSVHFLYWRICPGFLFQLFCVLGARWGPDSFESRQLDILWGNVTYDSRCPLFEQVGLDIF